MKTSVLKKELVRMAPKCIYSLLNDYAKEALNLKSTVRVSRAIQEPNKKSYFQRFTNSQRLIKSSDIKSYSEIMNVQQIKPSYNNVTLFLLFDDKIEITNFDIDKIKTDKNVNYILYNHQNKTQGRFHLTKGNAEKFINSYRMKTISYEELNDYINSKTV